MEFIDLTSPLRTDLAIFLKDNFNITDVDALTNQAYHKLYDELCEIEVHETCVADEKGTPMSDYGNMVVGIVTYMGNQFIEGGRRFKDEDHITVAN